MQPVDQQEENKEEKRREERKGKSRGERRNNLKKYLCFCWGLRRRGSMDGRARNVTMTWQAFSYSGCIDMS